MLEGHSVVLYRDDFFIFGGMDHATGKLSNTTYTTSLREATAQSTVARMVPIACAGQVPPPRAYHSCCLRGMFMLVLGGTVDDGLESAAPSGPNEALDEMVFYSLNLDSRTWSRYYVPSAQPGSYPVPQPRCHATLISMPDSVLFYGGFPQHGEAVHQPLMANHWSVFRLSGEADVAELPVSGASPMLWGHSAVYAHGCLLVFGGVDHPSAAEVSTLCVYHLEGQRWRWAEFPTAPPARALHTAVLDRGFMIVFGGFSTVEPALQTGTKGGGEAEGSAASRATYSVASSQFCDTWLFSLSTGLWTQLEVSSGTALPSPRSGHAACCNNGLMFVFGGLEGAPAITSSSSSPSGGSAASSALSNESTLAILDLDTRSWTIKKLVTSMAAPSTGSTLSQSPGRTASPPAARQGSSMMRSADATRDVSSPWRGEQRELQLQPPIASNAMTVAHARQLRAGGGQLPSPTTSAYSPYYPEPAPQQQQQQLPPSEAAGPTIRPPPGGMHRDRPIPPVPVKSYYQTLAPDHSLLVDNVVRMQREREEQIRAEREKLQQDVAAAYSRPAAPAGSYLPFGVPGSSALEEIPPSHLLLSVPLRGGKAVSGSSKKLFGTSPRAQQQQEPSLYGGLYDASLHTVISPWTELVDADELQRSTSPRHPPHGRLVVKRSPSQEEMRRKDKEVGGEDLDMDERLPTTVVVAPQLLRGHTPPRSHSASPSWGLQYNPLLPGPSLPYSSPSASTAHRSVYPQKVLSPF